jgi:hypothetical protein
MKYSGFYYSMVKRQFFLCHNEQSELTQNESDLQNSSRIFELGPTLCSICMSTIFDKVNMSKFADDNFILGQNKNLDQLKKNKEKALQAVSK